MPHLQCYVPNNRVVKNAPMTSGQFDAIVIGAGHNGLVTAAYLQRGGMKTLLPRSTQGPRRGQKRAPRLHRARWAAGRVLGLGLGASLLRQEKGRVGMLGRRDSRESPRRMS